jgi:hypothetical protein
VRGIFRLRQLAAIAAIATAPTATTSSSIRTATTAAAAASTAKIATASAIRAAFMAILIARTTRGRRTVARSYVARWGVRVRSFGGFVVSSGLLRRRRLARSRRRRLHIERLECRRGRSSGAEHLAALVLHLLNFFLGGSYDVVEFFEVFEEVADVEESVAIESDFNESRLHAGQHACNTALVDASN